MTSPENNNVVTWQPRFTPPSTCRACQPPTICKSCTGKKPATRDWSCKHCTKAAVCDTCMNGVAWVCKKCNERKTGDPGETFHVHCMLNSSSPVVSQIIFDDVNSISPCRMSPNHFHTAHTKAKALRCAVVRQDSYACPPGEHAGTKYILWEVCG